MHRTVPIVRLDDILNSERGLTQEEVDARLNQYGRNDIVEAPAIESMDVAVRYSSGSYAMVFTWHGHIVYFPWRYDRSRDTFCGGNSADWDGFVLAPSYPGFH